MPKTCRYGVTSSGNCRPNRSAKTCKRKGYNRKSPDWLCSPTDRSKFRDYLERKNGRSSTGRSTLRLQGGMPSMAWRRVSKGSKAVPGSAKASAQPRGVGNRTILGVVNALSNTAHAASRSLSNTAASRSLSNTAASQNEPPPRLGFGSRLPKAAVGSKTAASQNKPPQRLGFGSRVPTAAVGLLRADAAVGSLASKTVTPLQSTVQLASSPLPQTGPFRRLVRQISVLQEQNLISLMDISHYSKLQQSMILGAISDNWENLTSIYGIKLISNFLPQVLLLENYDDAMLTLTEAVDSEGQLGERHAVHIKLLEAEAFRNAMRAKEYSPQDKSTINAIMKSMNQRAPLKSRRGSERKLTENQIRALRLLMELQGYSKDDKAAIIATINANFEILMTKYHGNLLSTLKNWLESKSSKEVIQKIETVQNIDRLYKSNDPFFMRAMQTNGYSPNAQEIIEETIKTNLRAIRKKYTREEIEAILSSNQLIDAVKKLEAADEPPVDFDSYENALHNKHDQDRSRGDLFDLEVNPFLKDVTERHKASKKLERSLLNTKWSPAKGYVSRKKKRKVSAEVPANVSPKVSANVSPKVFAEVPAKVSPKVSANVSPKVFAEVSAKVSAQPLPDTQAKFMEQVSDKFKENENITEEQKTLILQKISSNYKQISRYNAEDRVLNSIDQGFDHAMDLLSLYNYGYFGEKYKEQRRLKSSKVRSPKFTPAEIVRSLTPKHASLPAQSVRRNKRKKTVSVRPRSQLTLRSDSRRSDSTKRARL